MATVWFEGVDQLNTVVVDLTRASVKAGYLASTVVQATAHRIEATAKRFCPVDTGNLRNSISADMTAPLSAEIGPMASYGVYVEFGTSRMAPHAFMGPALDRHTPEFVAALEKAADPLP